MLCKTCSQINTCKKICSKVKEYLKSRGIYSADWIRPQLPRSERKRLKKKGYKTIPKWREMPFSAFVHDGDRDEYRGGSSIYRGKQRGFLT